MPPWGPQEQGRVGDAFDGGRALGIDDGRPTVLQHRLLAHAGPDPTVVGGHGVVADIGLDRPAPPVRGLEGGVGPEEVDVGLLVRPALIEPVEGRADDRLDDGLDVGPGREIEREGDAPVDQDEALHPAGMALGRRGDHEAAHRVPGHGGRVDAQVIEDGDEVVAVGGRAEGPGRGCATGPTTVVDGDQAHAVVAPLDEQLGHPLPRPVVGGDPAGGHNHHLTGPPPAGGDAPTGHRQIEALVAHRHGRSLDADLSREAVLVLNPRLEATLTGSW